MTREEKAVLYDDYVREGDRINRKISALKSNVNLTQPQEAELGTLNNELQILESKVERLFLTE